MPLNYLLQRHQISLMHASAGATPEARAAHRGLAAGYARQIGTLQAGLGAADIINGDARGPDDHDDAGTIPEKMPSGGSGT